MFLSASFLSQGATTEGRFTNTYTNDFKPINERQPPLKFRTKAEPVSAHINPLQHIYRTTNSTYGSGVISQSPLSSAFPGSLPSFGVPAPSLSKAVGNVGSTLKEAGTQDARVSREQRVAFGGEDEANKLKEQESKDELQKSGVHYEEGVTVLSCLGPTCCDDVQKSQCREVRSLDPSMASTSLITVIYNTDDGNRENSTHLWDLSPAVGLQSSSVLQPPSRQCSHCAQEIERCCSEMHTIPPHIPQSRGQPLACAQPTNWCTGSIRKLPITEYQASYSAKWLRPQIGHCTHPRHRNPLL